ncbi:MAG: PQQ-binding-like beta-propeller repeat protein [Nitrososphaerota archaeon]|nr:PQQ-binding-like beta-propeller repeat protein [Nitrososphaerota archaeon]MDG6978366.1 PQQ-binding-like beta-propeller repeat protein [Nitrososphaerota archaeon]
MRTRAAIWVAAVVVLLSSSSLAAVHGSGGPAPAPQPPSDWIGPDGNFPFNWDYSPQTAINGSNVGHLDLKWLFPLPSPRNPSTLGSSVIITPIIAQGVVYYITSSDTVMAQDAANGQVLWSKDLSLNYNYPGIGVAPEAPNLEGHYHAIWYTTVVRGEPLIWIAADNYTIFALNAASGAEVMRLDYLPQGVSGNYGFYDPGGKQMVIDQARGILMVTVSDSEGTDAGRGFYEGWNVTASPPTLMWRTFVMPPQDGSDPLWSLHSVENASYAWVFNGTAQVNLKTLPNSTLYGMLYGDWGNMGFDGANSYAGTGGGWGGSDAFDPQTGIAYVTTAQPSPDWNATTRPGLDLWSSSVMALNETTGRMIWAFQTSPHDLSDYDCSWSVMLANATVDGQNQKVVMKGCKNGYFYALSAATGKMLWYFDAPTIARTPASQILDPTNRTEMVKPWANYPSTAPYIQNPCNSGGIESDPAYDPTTNLAFVATYNCPTYVSVVPTVGPGVPYGSFGRNLEYPPGGLPSNTSIWAIDVSTGKPVWQFPIPDVGFRGGVDVSGGLVLVPAADGYLRAISEQTGQLVSEKYIGSGLCTQPAVGQDIQGQELLVFPVCNGNEVKSPLPVNNGVMMALGLAPFPTNSTPTLTETVTSTLTSTLVTTSYAAGVPSAEFFTTSALAVAFAAATVALLALRKRRP